MISSIEIKKAVLVLRQGGSVVFPTDTAYGLAVDAANLQAVKKLYRLKGRNFKKPIHVIPPTQPAIGLFARISPWSKKLMKKFWPGPLTIVLPLKDRGKSWQMLSAKTKTIGIRIPKHKIAIKLAEKFGKPITATSANISGKNVCYSVAEAKKQFLRSKIKPDFYLNDGRLRRIRPSTVVSFKNGCVTILRPGPISLKQIQKALK